MRRHHPEDGSTSIELAITAPALLLLIGALILGARVSLAHQNVQGAASQAARAASIARTPTQAANFANAAASTYLANTSMRCSSISVTADTSTVAKQPGQPATVNATVSCTIITADLLIPGSGQRTITATATSAVDTYRENP